MPNTDPDSPRSPRADPPSDVASATDASSSEPRDDSSQMYLDSIFPPLPPLRKSPPRRRLGHDRITDHELEDRFPPLAHTDNRREVTFELYRLLQQDSPGALDADASSSPSDHVSSITSSQDQEAELHKNWLPAFGPDLERRRPAHSQCQHHPSSSTDAMWVHYENSEHQVISFYNIVSLDASASLIEAGPIEDSDAAEAEHASHAVGVPQNHSSAEEYLSPTTSEYLVPLATPNALANIFIRRQHNEGYHYLPLSSISPDLSRPSPEPYDEYDGGDSEPSQDTENTVREPQSPGANSECTEDEVSHTPLAPRREKPKRGRPLSPTVAAAPQRLDYTGPFNCPHCSAIFMRMKPFEDHIMSMHGHLSKPWKCTFCPTRFGRKYERIRHERCIHMNLKPYKCEQCGKRFGRTDALARHMLVEKKMREDPAL
ncbi:hypothetical protein BC832DRAFT_540071 [Gaertneriomyces semiglobifer]|nr:hypothetical protein BC832DRAFT_540071 [Gaertneriomyces semiglobifer]